MKATHLPDADSTNCSLLVPAPLVVNSDIVIPREELQFTFVRSSGPGGQNVNKVNTKAVLRWSVRETSALPSEVRQRLMARFARRINEAGELILASQQHRVQSRNAADCLRKLREMILAVAHPPRKRKKTRVPRSVHEARLRDKRVRGQRKKLRQTPREE